MTTVSLPFHCVDEPSAYLTVSEVVVPENEGDAEKLICHLTTSEANYAIVWTIIKEQLRFHTTAFINTLISPANIAAEIEIEDSERGGKRDTRQYY